MQPFETINGPAMVLDRDNVDTDVIIRIERLTELAKDELGPYAFEALRKRADGSPDPDCVFNQRSTGAAPILIAGRNFGCGSSREGAIWAIADLGIKCIIAPSFGGIFANNAFQNGMLTIELPDTTVRALRDIAAADPDAPFTVDLATATVRPPNGAPIKFEIAKMRQQALLEGRDDISMTLSRADDISAFHERDRTERPWIYTIG